MKLGVDPHPLLAATAFTSEFPRALGELSSPAWLVGLLALDAEAPLQREEDVRGKVRDLLRHGTAFVRRHLHALPVAHTWTHVPGVTLLGDAAHLMPPLGAGANLAMLDGAELAETVAAASGPGELDQAVRAFEKRMWARAETWAKITTAGLERLVSPDPAQALALFDEIQSS